MFFEDEEFSDKNSEVALNIDNEEWLICDGVLEKYRNKKIEEVRVPNGVTSINTYAIMTDYSIKSIYLPKSVKRLESTGIVECDNLTKVVIENPDIEIMEWGLSFNESLKEVYIGGKRIDGIVATRYSDGAKCFERYLGEGEEIVVEEGVKQINNNAFENCMSLTKIILPDTVYT
ncbi:MAG: leucine-rich repeat domain-containing protein, partial [Clostridia bacterium]|nr:leucine-rich repeat domain-containing protein [Clostridia bacterium]